MLFTHTFLTLPTTFYYLLKQSNFEFKTKSILPGVLLTQVHDRRVVHS